MRAGAGLLPLLLLLPACSRAAGNPVNHAAQQGSAHRITAESVAAWESLSRCEWAPLCPSLLIAVSFAGDNARQRAELVVRDAPSPRPAVHVPSLRPHRSLSLRWPQDGLGVLATELRGRAAFGYLYLPEVRSTLPSPLSLRHDACARHRLTATIGRRDRTKSWGRGCSGTARLGQTCHSAWCSDEALSCNTPSQRQT